VYHTASNPKWIKALAAELTIWLTWVLDIMLMGFNLCPFKVSKWDGLSQNGPS